LPFFKEALALIYEPLSSFFRQKIVGNLPYLPWLLEEKTLMNVALFSAERTKTS